MAGSDARCGRTHIVEARRMDSRLEVRLANIDDAATIAAMRVRSSAERRSIRPELHAAYFATTRAALEAGLRAESIFVWLACKGNRAVGTATLMLLPTLPRYDARSPHDGRIRNVYVEPEYRRRGIALRLTRAAIDKARALQVDRLTLGTSPMGRGLYERLGFRTKEDEMIFCEPADGGAC
jgi:GNAT superfamily N-acetyltransferase